MNRINRDYYLNKLIERRNNGRINDSYRKIVIVHNHIVPWYDENGIFYIVAAVFDSLRNGRRG